MSACMAMRSLVLAAGRGGGGEQRSGGRVGNGGGRGRGRRGRGSGRGSGAPDGPDTASRREGRAGYGYKNAPMERRGPSSGGRGRASRGQASDGQSNARGARNNPSPNAIDEAGACDTMPQALMSLELGHPRCPMCAQTFASGGTRARHLALCCPDLIDPVGWRRGDERVVRRCAALRHPKSSFRWAVLSRRFGWSDDDVGADGGAEDTAVHGSNDDEDTAVGSSLGGIVSSRRREAARLPDTDASTRPAPMTAKATARALRVDLATVTKLVRHEIRDVPLQPERIPLHVVYEDECMMAVAKPSGVMTYPAHRLRGGSVVSRAVHHLNVEAAVRRGEDPSGVNDSSSVFSASEPIAVHRLDLETSGLLLLAKDKRTATELQSQFEGRRVRKTYLAVCAVLEDAPAAQKAAETRAKIREEEEEAENNADEDEDEEVDGEELGVFDETDLEDDLDVNDDDDETDDDGDDWELDEFDEPGQVRVVNAAIGTFLFMFVWAIGMTSCFV